MARGADLRTDVPRYRVFRDGELVDEPLDAASRYGPVHGAPVHVGDAAAIGVEDLGAPDYGDPVEVRDGEVPVFWACGVTPQAVAVASRPELMIAHAPGHMFVTDARDETMAML